MEDIFNEEENRDRWGKGKAELVSDVPVDAASTLLVRGATI